MNVCIYNLIAVDKATEALRHLPQNECMLHMWTSTSKTKRHASGKDLNHIWCLKCTTFCILPIKQNDPRYKLRLEIVFWKNKTHLAIEYLFILCLCHIDAARVTVLCWGLYCTVWPKMSFHFIVCSYVNT